MLPEESFVRPVDGHADLVAFTYPFLLEGKAIDSPPVEELEDGDLIIEGWAADFTGDDRQLENFTNGAFERGVKSFLNGTASLNYHHKHDHVLGKVLELEEREGAPGGGSGLWMRARVDGALKDSPLKHIYQQIKRGTLKGLSVGGFFKRAFTAGGRKIVDVDLTEISVTNVPVHSRPAFAVVAGKALEDFEDPSQVSTHETPDLTGLSDALDRLSESLGVKALPSKHDPESSLWLAMTLRNVGKLREHATSVKDIVDHEKFKSLADEIETSTAKWQSDAHKIAAQIGPLPTLGE